MKALEWYTKEKKNLKARTWFERVQDSDPHFRARVQCVNVMLLHKCNSALGQDLQ